MDVAPRSGAHLRRRRRRSHRIDAALAARGRVAARQRAADHLHPSQGARAEPARDGDPDGCRRRGCDLRARHAGGEHAAHRVLRGLRGRGSRVRPPDRAARVVGSRRARPRLGLRESVPPGQPAADPAGTDPEGARRVAGARARALPPRARRLRRGCGGSNRRDPRQGRRPDLPRARSLFARVRRRAHRGAAPRREARGSARSFPHRVGLHERRPLALGASTRTC